jgi:tetratricopeptide (TPR) repeat protein
MVLKITILLLSCVTVFGASPQAQTGIASIRALISEGKVPEALRQLQLLRTAHPDDPTLQMEVGEILQELAASRAELLRKAAPDSAQAHELAGKSLESHQKLTDALKEYQLAEEKQPALPGIHFSIGNIYWKLGDLGRARAALSRELALNPAHVQANLRMGQAILRADENEAQIAVPYLKKAIEGDSRNLEAHRELGKALRLTGRPAEALKELKLVASARPDDMTIHAQLAAAYRAVGDTDSARREMELHAKLLQAEHARSRTGP